MSRKDMFRTLLLGMTKMAHGANPGRRELLLRAGAELEWGPPLVLDRLHERYQIVRARVVGDDDALRILLAEYLKDSEAAMNSGQTYSAVCEERMAARRDGGRQRQVREGDRE